MSLVQKLHLSSSFGQDRRMTFVMSIIPVLFIVVILGAILLAQLDNKGKEPVVELEPAGAA